jgi:hypothetical protein
MKNLARLVVATHDSNPMSSSLRRRALVAYMDACGETRPWKAVWRQLQEISRIRRLRKAA